jgi:hypothetical protein
MQFGNSLVNGSKLKRSRQKLAVILVAYDWERTIYSLGALDLLCNRLKVSEKIIIWNSSNTKTGSLELITDNWKLIHGSNKHYEFSGWQEGINYLSSHLHEYRYFIFANDTIARRNSDTRKSNFLCALEPIIVGNKDYEAIGLVHQSPTGISVLTIGELHVRRWMCTGCFALNGSLLAKLGFKIDNSDLSTQYLSTIGNENLLNEKASIPLKLHIEYWLSDQENGWHGAIAKPWNTRDLSVLRMKTLMILNELVLSSNIYSLGAKCYDPTKPSLNPPASTVVSGIKKSLKAFVRFFKG